MCKLTTRQGVTWEIITINGKAAYQAGSLLIFFDPRMNHHKLVDGFLSVRMTGTLQDCLECVQHAEGRAVAPLPIRAVA